MAQAAIILADGFETAEALTTVDVLRRAGVKTTLVSAMGTVHVISGQQVRVEADATLDEFDVGAADCIVVPGGSPASRRLAGDERVRAALAAAMADPSKTVAAICSGPTVLADFDLVGSRRLTAFPAFRERFPQGSYIEERVVVDGNLVTGRSMNCSLEFAVAVASVVGGEDAARRALSGIGGCR